MYGSKTMWTKKQKIIMALTIITFGILVWQIYSLVKNDIKPQDSTLNNTQSVSSSESIPASTSTFTEVSKTNQMVKNNPDTPQTVNHLPARTLRTGSDFSSNQEQYMHISNEYELAKMQRKLLEEKVAIASARKNIVDTEQQTNKILGSNNSELINDPSNSSSWRLAFLSQRQDGQWHATLQHAGEYHDVKEGTKLLDGTKILHIDKYGVKFEFHGIVKMITFEGVKTLSLHAVSNDPSANHFLKTTHGTTSAQDKNHSDISSNDNISGNGNSNTSSLVPASKTPAVPQNALPNL